MTIRQALKKILGAEAPQQIPTLGRNQSCWCGSGKKYKQCHLASDDRRRASARASQTKTAKGGMF